MTFIDDAMVTDVFGQDSLVTENTPDPLANEQTWPTEDEERQAESKYNLKKNKKLFFGFYSLVLFLLVLKVKFMKRRVPKGTSDYQAGWILDADEEDGEFPDEEDDDEEEEGSQKKQLLGLLCFFITFW